MVWRQLVSWLVFTPHNSNLACEFNDITISWYDCGAARWSSLVSTSLKSSSFPVCQPSASPKLTTQSTVGPASHTSPASHWPSMTGNLSTNLWSARYHWLLSPSQQCEIYNPESHDCETSQSWFNGQVFLNKWIIKFLPVWKIPDSDIRTVPCPQKTVKIIVLETMETLKTSHWSWTRPLMDTFFLLRILLTRVSFSGGHWVLSLSPRIIGSNNRPSPD